MNLLDFWSNALISPAHALTLAAVALATGLTIYLNAPASKLQRVGLSIFTVASVLAVGPLVVSPIYVSAGALTWTLALIGGVSLIGSATTHAVRAAYGYTSSTKIEWSTGLIGFVTTWIAMLFAGAPRWAVVSGLSFAVVYMISRRMVLVSRDPGVGDAQNHDEAIKLADLLVILPALSGVAWAGVPVLVLMLLLHWLGSRSRTHLTLPALASSQVSVVSGYGLIAALPIVLIVSGTPTMPLHF